MSFYRIKQSAWTLFFSAFVAIILVAIAGLIIINASFLGMSDLAFYLGKTRTWINFLNTFWTASLATLFSMLIGVPVGYTLSRFNLPFHKVMKTVIDLPIMVPPAAIGLFLLGVFETAPIGTVTQFLGIRIDHALPGIIVAQCTVTVSFCIRLVMASFDTVEPRFEQVARSLGATLPHAFLRVSLPMAKNGLMASVIIVWARAAAEWESLMIFIGGIQGRSDVMPFAVYLDFTAGKLGWALTTSLLCIAVSVVSMAAVHYIGGAKRVW
jgi:ABC-type sulfate transport system permease component